MNTREQSMTALPIRSERASLDRQNQWATPQTNAAILALAFNLPAFVAIFEAFTLQSSGLFFIGFSFLIGIGVPSYFLLRWLLEADLPNQTDRALDRPARTVDEAVVGVPLMAQYAFVRTARIAHAHGRM